MVGVTLSMRTFSGLFDPILDRYNQHSNQTPLVVVTTMVSGWDQEAPMVVVVTPMVLIGTCGSGTTMCAL